MFLAQSLLFGTFGFKLQFRYLHLLLGGHGRFGLVLFHQCLSLVLGLLVVKGNRAEGRSGSTLSSLKVGVHVGVYVVGGLTGFVLEVIEMRKHVGSVVFVRMLLRVDRGPVDDW